MIIFSNEFSDAEYAAAANYAANDTFSDWPEKCAFLEIFQDVLAPAIVCLFIFVEVHYNDVELTCA